MVINLRGTGGSGKSTVVRRVMERFDERLPNHIPGRKQPISYLLRKQGVPDLRVLGHYEIPTGGCDTISLPDDVYRMVHQAVDLGENVLFEGIIIGDDVTRLVDLHLKLKKLNNGNAVKVIALSTPIETCLAGIQSRRDAKGNTKPLSPDNTVNRLDRLKRLIMPRLKDANVDATWMDRDKALEITADLLGVSIPEDHAVKRG